MHYLSGFKVVVVNNFRIEMNCCSIRVNQLTYSMVRSGVKSSSVRFLFFL